MSDPGFWDDAGNSAKVVKQLKSLKSTVEPWEIVFNKYQELKEYLGAEKKMMENLLKENQEQEKQIEDLKKEVLSGTLNQS